MPEHAITADCVWRNWLGGTVDGLPFAAKICDVNSPDGIDNGRVLKLFLYAEDGEQELAAYERGWSIYPTGEHEASMDALDYWGCPNHIEHYNYLDEPSQSSFSYVLPLHQENNPNYVVLPEYLSAFILETIHQEMLSNVNISFDPITLTGGLSYQDINGKNIERIFELKFNMFPNSSILFYAPELFLQIESEQLQTN